MKHLLPSLLFASMPLGALATEPPAPCQPGMPPRVHAAQAPSREQIAMRIMVRQLLLNRYDENQDGKVEGEEHHQLMTDAHAARKQQALSFVRRFDADGDGKLSPEERAAMQQAMQERREAAKGAERPRPPHPHAGKRPPHGGRHHGARPPHPHMGEKGRLIALLTHHLTMDAYDADKNGILDTTESARLREDGAALYRAREAELLSLHDTDKDGKLSEAEFRAAVDKFLPHPPHSPQAKGEAPPPPPHPHRHTPIKRLLDTHFDIDILAKLACPEAGETNTPPCAPSTPSTN